MRGGTIGHVAHQVIAYDGIDGTIIMEILGVYGTTIAKMRLSQTETQRLVGSLINARNKANNQVERQFL